MVNLLCSVVYSCHKYRILSFIWECAVSLIIFLKKKKNQPFWQPHNRTIARRIQNMGWRADGGLWLLVRGGGLYLSKGTGVSMGISLLLNMSSISCIRKFNCLQVVCFIAVKFWFCLVDECDFLFLFFLMNFLFILDASGCISIRIF